MRCIRTVAIVIGLAAPFVPYGAADAGSCALRDRTRSVYELYPESTAFSTFVGYFSLSQGKRLEKEVGVDVRLADLGATTVCVPLIDTSPVGFLQARADLGELGLVELVWALDLDLRVREVRVQRSRETHSATIRDASFREQFVGKGLRDLVAWKNDPTTGVVASVPKDARPLVTLFVESGIKAAAILSRTFDDEVRSARLLGHIHRIFKGTSEVKRVTEPLSQDAIDAIRDMNGCPPDQIANDTFVLLRAVGDDGTLGWLAHARLRAEPTSEVWWAVSPEGTVRETLVHDTNDAGAPESAEELHGRDLGTLTVSDDGAASPLIVATREVLCLIRARTRPATRRER